jgi:hypothetical protein
MEGIHRINWFKGIDTDLVVSFTMKTTYKFDQKQAQDSWIQARCATRELIHLFLVDNKLLLK